MALKSMRKKSTNCTPKEDQEQIWFSAWLTKQGIKHTASANGTKRSLLTALKLKKMGLSPGFPDIEIPLVIPGVYAGLYIEMKRTEGSKLSPEQIDWLNYLNAQGYYAKAAYGYVEARNIVEYYLALMPKSA